MKNPQKNPIHPPQGSLRERILNAAPVQVMELIAPSRAVALPHYVQRLVLPMEVEWSDNRAWGQSFRLGDSSLVLGHRRGDHLATHPHLFGMKPKEAEAFLRLQLEGTVLHEIGHAMVADLRPRMVDDTIAQAIWLLDTEGPMSTYLGHGDVMGLDDQAHEAVAEAVRYWCHQDRKLRMRYPGWHRLVDNLVAWFR